MTIEDMIKELQEIQQKHGNVECYMYDTANYKTVKCMVNYTRRGDVVIDTAEGWE